MTLQTFTMRRPRPSACPRRLAAYRGRDGMERYYHEHAEAFDGGEVHIRSVEAAVEEDIVLVYWVRALEAAGA
jgi:hypothetical protein